MKKNISNKDKGMRIAAAALFIFLMISGVIVYPESILVWIIVAIFVITAITGHCPAYTLFGINTKDKRKYS